MPTCPKCAHEWHSAKKPLTLRQSEIVTFIEVYRDLRRCSPSYAEIAERFGFQSLATVHEHMENLERKGHITREFNIPRSIELVA